MTLTGIITCVLFGFFATLAAHVALTLLGGVLDAATRQRTPDGHALVSGADGHRHYIAGLPGDTHYVHATDVCWCRKPVTADDDGHQT